MKRTTMILSACIAAALAAGCASNSPRDYRYSSEDRRCGINYGAAALGAVAGGVLGNQVGRGTGKTVAAAAGAVAGAMAANELAKECR